MSRASTSVVMDGSGLHCTPITASLGKHVTFEGSRASNQATKSAFYHLTSVWFFTYTDIKTIIAPSFAFAVISVFLHAPKLHQRPLEVLLQNAPRGLFWTWSNLLPFAIDNQRQDDAIAEDAVNKPWRTMPSGRMTQQVAKRIMQVMYAVALCAGVSLGGYRQTLALMGLGHWYNHLGGSEHPVVRNLINGMGFMSFLSGTSEAMLGGADFAVRGPALQWLVLVGAVVFSTVHTQDMYDQAGDAARGRVTVPIAIGDWPARVTIAVAMTVWSVACPLFWEAHGVLALVSAAMGLTVAVRSLTWHSVAADKTTFRLWNAWLVSIYLLPLGPCGRVI